MEKRCLSCSKDWTTLTITNLEQNKTLYINYCDIDRIEFDEIFIRKYLKKNTFRKNQNLYKQVYKTHRVFQTQTPKVL